MTSWEIFATAWREVLIDTPPAATIVPPQQAMAAAPAPGTYEPPPRLAPD